MSHSTHKDHFGHQSFQAKTDNSKQTRRHIKTQKNPQNKLALGKKNTKPYHKLNI